MTARIASLFTVACAAGLAGGAFHRGFALGSLAGLLVLAACVPVAVAGLLARGNRRPPQLPVSVLVSVLLWLALTATTLFRNGSPHAGGVLPALWDGLVNGGVRLLDVTLPAPGSPDLLVVPQGLTWLAALVGAEIVTRTRALVAPVVPALVAFAVGVAFTVSGPGSNLGVAAGLVVTSGALIMFRRAEAADPGRAREAGHRWLPPDGERVGTGRVLGLFVVLAVTAAGLLAGPALTTTVGGDPYDIRRHRGVPLHPETTMNPLDAVSAWLTSPDEVLFRVTPALSGNIRLAVLDRFDGQQWTSSARYTPAGARVPAEPRGRAPAGEFRQDIEIVDLVGSFLPHLDRPVTLEGTGLAVDAGSGALLTTVPISSGRRYTVVSAVPPALDAAELASLGVATGPDADAARTLPAGIPAPLTDAARLATDGSSSPFQQVYRLEQYLRSRFTYDPAAPAGHTYGHLNYFLGQSHTGTSEQFATLFAVLARVLEMPSRVVVGFSPPRGGEHTDVRSGDVLVWPEVEFEGVGWMPFYPTPEASGTTGGGEVATTARGESAERAQQVAQAALAMQEPAAPPTPDAPPGTPVGVVIGVVAASVALVAAVGYAVLAAALPVSRRRRRRAARGNRERVIGAWLDALDSFEHVGVPVSRASTPTEIVTHGMAVVGAGGREPLGGLADLATAALFAPDPVSPADADIAWQYGKELRAHLRRATPMARRVRCRLVPGPVSRRIGGPAR